MPIAAAQPPILVDFVKTHQTNLLIWSAGQMFVTSDHLDQNAAATSQGQHCHADLPRAC